MSQLILPVTPSRPVQQKINLRRYWGILPRRKGLALLVLEQVKQLTREVAALQGRMNDYYRSNPFTNTRAAQDQVSADCSQMLQKQQAARTAVEATQRESPRVQDSSVGLREARSPEI